MRSLPPLNPFGPSIPPPSVLEREGDTAWGEFNAALQEQDRAFSPTLPHGEELDAPVPPPTLPVRASHAVTSAEQVMRVARQDGRICPSQEHWVILYSLLHQAAGERGVPPPPLPVMGDAWVSTSAAVKRMAFLHHLEWADQHGLLAAAYAFVTGLPEDSWVKR